MMTKYLGIRWRAIVALLMPIVAIAAAPDGDGKQEAGSTAVAYEQTRKELSRALQRPGMSPLPATIGQIYAFPHNVPVFVFDFFAQAQLGGPVVKNDAASLNHPGDFRLLLGQKIHSASLLSGEILVAHHDNSVAGRRIQAIEKDGARTVHILKNGQLGMRNIYRDGKWWLEIDGGFVGEDGTELPDEAQQLLRTTREFFGANGKLVIVNSPRSSAAPWPVEVKVFGKNWQKEGEFSGQTWERTRAYLVLEKGGCLAVGYKIRPIKDDQRASPKPEMLERALKLAENGEFGKLQAMMPVLSAYNATDLRGMATLLRKLPDPYQEAQRLTSAAYSHESSIKQFLETPAVADGEALGSKELLKTLTDQLQQLDGYRQRLTEQLVAAGAQSPSQLGSMLTSNWQFFDGKWIRIQSVLPQRDLGEVLMVVATSPGIGMPTETTLCALRSDGRLHEIHSETQALAKLNLAGATSFPGPKGRKLLFSRRGGLLEIKNDRLMILDDSPELLAMSAVIGCDARGRIFFSAPGPTQPNGRRSNAYWVYNGKGEKATTHNYRLIETGRALVDDQERLWYVKENRTHSASNESAPAGLITEKDVEQVEVNWSLQSGQVRPRPGSSYSNDSIMVHHDGAFRQFFQTGSLRGAHLVKGAEGAVFVINAGTQARYLIADKQVVVGNSLHELATQYPELMTRYAPREGTQENLYGTASRYGTSASLCRVGDVLWVHDGSRIEAYRQGKSLGVHRRLTLTRNDFKPSMMLGPVGAGRDGILLCNRSGSIDHLWVVPDGDEGVTFSELSLPPLRQGETESQYRSALRSDAPPAVSLRDGSVWQPLRDKRLLRYDSPQAPEVWEKAGEPVIYLNNGNLLVRNLHHHLNAIYAEVSKEGRKVVGPTELHHYEIVAHSDSGDYLAVGADGPRWLRATANGTWQPDEKTLLPITFTVQQYLGRMPDGVAFLVSHATGNRTRQFVAIVAD